MEKKETFFDSFSKGAQFYFLSKGYTPETFYDATNFINGMAGVDNNRAITFKYKRHGKINSVDITKDNYYIALNPHVWKTLSTEDKVYVLYNAYKSMLKEKNITERIPLIWAYNDYGTYESGASEKDNAFVYLGFDFALNKDEYNGLLAYSVLAHELNHVNQNLTAQNLKNTKIEQNDYQQSLHFVSIIRNVFEKNLHLLDSKRKNDYNKIKNTDEWLDYLDQTYLGNLAEISSGNIQYKALKNMSKKCYEYFGLDYKKDDILQNLIDDTKNIYNFETAEQVFSNNTLLINKINNLMDLYDSYQQQLTFVKNVAELKVMELEKCRKTKNNKTLLNKYNKILDDVYEKQKHINYGNTQCMNAIIDLYINKKVDNFDTSLFEDINKKLYQDNELDDIIERTLMLNCEDELQI